MQSPYKNYIKQEVEGATKGKLVLLLYDGAIKFMRISMKAMDEKDIPTAHNNIMKAQNILYELMNSLNMEAGDISKNLMRLYDFMVWQLIEANKDKNKDKVENVVRMMSNLRDAWRDVVQKEEGGVIPSQETTGKSINFAG
ncbi:MAG: flagellar export chaperone FliS [Deferribacterales bacterium]